MATKQTAVEAIYELLDENRISDIAEMKPWFLNMEKANRSDLDAWGDQAEEYSKRQKQLHEELVNKKLMEMELENTTSEKTNITNNDNTIQTQPDLIWAKLKPNKTWWTETKLWIVSSIFFITFLTLGWFYPIIALVICLITLGAVFLYVLVWLGTILLKEILGLDDK
jgi:hypothetical protein